MQTTWYPCDIAQLSNVITFIEAYIKHLWADTRWMSKPSGLIRKLSCKIVMFVLYKKRQLEGTKMLAAQPQAKATVHRTKSKRTSTKKRSSVKGKLEVRRSQRRPSNSKKSSPRTAAAAIQLLHPNANSNSAYRACFDEVEWGWAEVSDWQMDWLAECLTDRLTDWLTGWLTGWLTDWLIDWVTDWPYGLIEWLTDRLTDWLPWTLFRF